MKHPVKWKKILWKKNIKQLKEEADEMLFKSLINANAQFKAILDKVYHALHGKRFFNNNNFEMNREEKNKKPSRKNKTKYFHDKKKGFFFNFG